MPLSFDETPKLPPEVGAQMGGGPEGTPFSGVGKMMAAEKPGGPAPGGASPSGAIQSAADAVEKVLDNMAKMSDAFKPFANRMKQIMQAGVAEAAKAGPQGNSGPPAGGKPEVSAKPPDAGASFPG